jgi:hypothetical protein
MNKITGKMAAPLALAALLALSLGSCLSMSSIAQSDIPAESAEPTPFEGMWYGVQSGLSYTYQFTGNTFFVKSKRVDMDKPSAWQKGVFTYTDKTISLITTAGIDVNSAMIMNRPYAWISAIGLARNNGAFVTTVKFALNAEGLSLDKTLCRNVTGSLQSISGPEEYVFFYNENNWASNSTANPYAFSIEQIDDAELVKLSNILGAGYQNAAEEREPGSHKITFRQTRQEGNRTNEVYGHFTKDYSPGLYRFAVYTDKYSVFMPDNLPPVPPNHARVVIIRTEFGKSESLYDYIDASL